MAGDHVPAHLVAELQRALQVYPGADDPGADRGPRQALVGYVDGEPAAAIGGTLVDQGHARAGAGDRGADRHPAHIMGGCDLDAGVAATLDRADATDVGDDAGEQGAELRPVGGRFPARSEEHTSELQSLMRISYAVFCLKKKKN